MDHNPIDIDSIQDADLYSRRNELETRVAALLAGEQVDPVQLAKDQMVMIANMVKLLCVVSRENIWNPAATPPEGEAHKWTRDVVVVTSAGKAYTMAYMHGPDGDGVWQSPAQLEHGEEIEWWTEFPATK